MFATGQAGRSWTILVVLGALLVTLGAASTQLETVLAIRLFGSALFVALLLGIIRPRFSFSWKLSADAVRYGSFILVTSVIAMLLDTVDRYAVGLHANLAEVGAYVVHVKLAAILVQGVVTPFMLWFPAERFRHMRPATSGDEFFPMAASALASAFALSGGSLFILGPLLVRIMAPDVTFEPSVFLLLCGAVFALGMTYALNIGLLKPGATHWNVLPSAAGFIVAGLTCLALVPGLGTVGAASGKFAGFVVAVILTAYLSQRIEAVPFAYGRLLAIVLAAGAIVFGVERAMPGDNLPILIGKLVAFNLLTLAAIALLFWAHLRPLLGHRADGARG